MVHETLKKCYDDARLTKLNTLDELVSFYNGIWLKNWNDSIAVNEPGVNPELYLNLGRKMLENYYKRYTPFDSDITIGTELGIIFPLDDAGNYQMRGYIDRLARTQDGVYFIHDYKTSANLPYQEKLDSDHQLALYQIGVQKKWPHIEEIRLTWHFLAHDCELLSSRSETQLKELISEVIRLIDEIESAEDFPPRESGLCDWCEYPDLCPVKKHPCKVDSLPPNEYRNEPGVVLVNKYADLKEKAAEIESETEKVKEALVEYSKREGATVIKGSNRKARVVFGERIKFPGKRELERQCLEDIIIKAGKWSDVSDLDIVSLEHMIKAGTWDRELIRQVMQYSRAEQTCAVYLSKLKEGEEPE
jgi:hypothetical protein